MMPGYFVILLRIGLAHMVERPVRTVLTIVGVALGVAAFVSVRTANMEVLRSFENTVATVAGSASLEVVSGELGFDETLIRSVRSVPGVTSATPILESAARLTAGPHVNESLQILGIDLLDTASRQAFRIRDEESPVGDLEQLVAADGLFLGQDLAAEWALTVGSRLHVVAGSREATLQVRGVIEAGETARSVWGRMAVMDIAAAQHTFGFVGRLDRIELVTAPSEPVDRLQTLVQRALPPSVIVQRPESRGKQVETMVRAFQMNLTVLSLVGLLVGVFLIYNTIAFSVAQRRREIGIFRAVGMSERMIGILFVGEAAMMGIIGGLLGAVAGVVVARVLVGLLSRTVTELFSPIAPAFITVGGAEWIAVLLEGGLLGGGVSALGALGPSVDAAKTIVVMALAPGGYDATQQTRIKPVALLGCLFLLVAAALLSGSPVDGTPVFGYMAAFFLLAGFTCLVPLCIQTVHGWSKTTQKVNQVSTGHAIRQIAVEQIARSATRSAVTVSALLVGVAIMVGVVMMVRSFRHTVELWIDQTVIADLIVAPHAWLQGTQGSSADKTLPVSLRDRIQSVEGVAAVDTYRDIRVLVTGKSVALVSRDLRMHAERSRYLFLSGDSRTILHEAVDRGAVVVSEVLAQRLAVVQGGMLELPTSSGIRSFPVQGIFYDYATDGGKIVMDRATYQKWWNDDAGVTVFPVYMKDNQDLAQVRQRIVRLMAEGNRHGVVPSIVSNRELRKEILDIFDRTFVLTYALETIAVLIAILGIVNTLVTSVLERRREFAILQALGASERQIKLLVLWESIYLAAIGTFLGAVGGLLLSSILIKVVNKQSFGWTIQMEWTPSIWIEAVVVAAGVALFAGWWPARWASKQPIVDGLRYE